MHAVGDRLLCRGDYVWGSFVRPSQVDGYILGINPGERTDTLGRFSFAAVSVDNAVSAARDGGRTWARVPLSERAQAIARVGDLFEDAAAHLAVLLTRETGKPLWESEEEVQAAIKVCRLLAQDGLASLEPQVIKAGRAWSDHQPHGVVGVITPCVFPLLVPTLHCLSAMLAGNSVVFKPSKFSPGVGQALADRIDRCRLPRGTFNMVQGSGSSVGQRIATHPGLDALLFAGSYEAAVAIRRATVDRPELPTFFQCGGKASAIVMEGADLERAAYDLAVGGFATAGQRHNSTSRVFVERAVFDRFSEVLVARTRELVVGYGFDDDVFMGPMISDSHRARFRKHGQALAAAGHTPLIEARNAEVEGHRGFYVGPAVYWVTGEAGLEREPVGPLLHIELVDDWEQGVERHNALASRVATSVFLDLADTRLDEIAARLSTGALNINRGTIGSSLRLPAVGRGRAGNGVPSDLALLRFLSTRRANIVDRRSFDSARWIPGAGSLPPPDTEEA